MNTFLNTNKRIRGMKRTILSRVEVYILPLELEGFGDGAKST